MRYLVNQGDGDLDLFSVRLSCDKHLRTLSTLLKNFRCQHTTAREPSYNPPYSSWSTCLTSSYRLALLLQSTLIYQLFLSLQKRHSVLYRLWCMCLWHGARPQRVYENRPPRLHSAWLKVASCGGYVLVLN